MFFQFNLYGVILVIASIISIFLLKYCYDKKEDIIYYYLGLYTLFCFFNFLFHGLEILTTPFIVKSFFGQSSALGYLFIPPVWFFLVYSITHERKDLSKNLKRIILAYPVFMLFLAITNPWIHLYWKSITLSTSAYKFGLAYHSTIFYSILFHVSVLYSYWIIYNDSICYS